MLLSELSQVIYFPMDGDPAVLFGVVLSNFCNGNFGYLHLLFLISELAELLDWLTRLDWEFLPHDCAEHSAFQEGIAPKSVVAMNSPRHFTGRVQSRNNVLVLIKDAALLINCQTSHAVMQDGRDSTSVEYFCSQILLWDTRKGCFAPFVAAFHGITLVLSQRVSHHIKRQIHPIGKLFQALQFHQQSFIHVVVDVFLRAFCRGRRQNKGKCRDFAAHVPLLCLLVVTVMA
mmetsp:Transcript_159/g.369  ORF Transcript_159/g.369 Transcript_159/m.369 type:complete len:231 (+) Transcript_159:177-869(+)